MDGSVKKLKNDWIFKKLQLKWKIVKHFMRPKMRLAFRKLFSLPPNHPHQKKCFYVFGKKFSYRHIQKVQTFAFKVFQKCSSCASRNGAVQMFSLTPSINKSAGKFWKSERSLAVLQEHIIFSVKWVEVRKISQVFRAKLYCVMSDLFR